MTVEKTELANNVLMITLGGRLDVGTTQIMRNEVSSIPEGIERVILDIRDLSYISSAGLRVLLKTFQILHKKNGRMVIEKVSDEFYDILKLSGFTDFLEIYKR